VVVRSYGRYDVNDFHFRSVPFESTCPGAVTVNSGVVTRAINDFICLSYCCRACDLNILGSRMEASVLFLRTEV
jgi:hypothetical protein